MIVRDNNSVKNVVGIICMETIDNMIGTQKENISTNRVGANFRGLKFNNIQLCMLVWCVIGLKLGQVIQVIFCPGQAGRPGL